MLPECQPAVLEYKAATDIASALIVMQTGGPDPDKQGRLAYQNAKAESRVVPTIIFHGNEDLVVNVKNGHQVLSQWAQMNDYADDGFDNDSINEHVYKKIHGQVLNGYRYTRSIYSNTKGNAIMEKWIVEGMGMTGREVARKVHIQILRDQTLQKKWCALFGPFEPLIN